MARKKLDSKIIDTIRDLRQKGYSLPEISIKLSVPKTTVFRYVVNVEILPEYMSEWAGKRGGSRKRMLIKEQKALEKGMMQVKELSFKEKLLYMCALYWAEGSKKDLGLSNTDPELIRIFVNGLREVFGVADERLRISIRTYSDLDEEKCLNFWSLVVGIPKNKFLKTYVLDGKKHGKLEYGMCRVRVLKGGDILKEIRGINKAFVQAFSKAGKISHMSS